ncbi:MAG: UPF0365 family protein [Chlamydiae bacterium]|nr:UPF0365 family protein [Chlamydiota bacterium]
MSEFIHLISIFATLVVLFFIIVFGRFISLWFQAFVSGTPISLFNIFGMSLRKIPPRLIVTSRINAFKAGLKEISVSDLETHYLAGGHVSDVVRACIAADKANISLDWRRATAIDLAGRDVFEAVKTSVNPKVIDCPSEKGKYISAVAKNGIELEVRARVTVRTNIMQLVGGATEETIIARVGEGIVNAIGSASSHHEVLANPQSVSELVLSKGLDAQTAFEILSIDIADINVGSNIGAILQSDQALADMKVAQAKAEGRKAMAIAEEQEYSARVKKAEAEIPLAIAKAFEKGNLGVMDYYKLENMRADTKMRSSFAFDEHKEEKQD